MESNFYIVDDDKVIRQILKTIITDQNLGNVLGIADNGWAALREIKELKPEIVLIDLLMPEIDGIEVIADLRKSGCESMFIMISQVDSKQMISRAYDEGIEFYISKPLNVTEVISVVKKVQEKIKMVKVIHNFETAFKSMNSLRSDQPAKKPDDYDQKAKIKKVLSQLGILGEAGCQDLIEVILWLKEQGPLEDSQQSNYKLFQAYDHLRRRYQTEQGQGANIGAIEQRIRRAIKSALKNLANLGIEDYYDDIFVKYSTALFDFSEVRKEMDFERSKSNYGGKINVKKFIEGILIILME